MRVSVDLKFKVAGSNRIHHLLFPAVLTTDDNCLETKDMKLEAISFEGISVDCCEGRIENSFPFNIFRDTKNDSTL